jgi:ribosomal protein S18 acetylase RimI-like enzyme
MSDLRICLADYANPAHAKALVDVLDDYARDPMGGGEGLSAYARTHLVSSLAARPFMFSVLAFADGSAETPVGLVNCVEGFSTFACKPLVNVHDFAVLTSHRRQGIGEKMLAFVGQLAKERGACKLTLEVLQGNTSAKALYMRAGFADYQLDEAMGSAQFMQKYLEESP